MLAPLRVICLGISPAHCSLCNHTLVGPGRVPSHIIASAGTACATHPKCTRVSDANIWKRGAPRNLPFPSRLEDHPFRVSTAQYKHREHPDEMAEVAGLALGVIAMTSLFKDCVDLFLYFDSARNSDREYQFLDTKLDIERTLLLKWEERVRLTNRDYDRRLDDDRTHAAILKALRSVKELLSKGKQLRARYEPQPLGNLDIQRSAGLSDLEDMSSLHPREPAGTKLVRRFIQRLKTLDLRGTDRRRIRILTLPKVRWAIWDKNKFECLIQDLSYFTTRLNDLVPDRLIMMAPMTRWDMEGQRILLDGFRDGSAIRSAATNLVDENYQRRSNDQGWFRVMSALQATARSPYYDTLKSILEPPQQARPKAYWNNFREWLQGGSGSIFWMNGKPGSGKSTLMKYVPAQYKTIHGNLQSAAGGQSRKAYFFYWRPGADLQRGQEAFRALLFAILDSEPALIRECPSARKKPPSRKRPLSYHPRRTRPWQPRYFALTRPEPGRQTTA